MEIKTINQANIGIDNALNAITKLLADFREADSATQVEIADYLGIYAEQLLTYSIYKVVQDA